MGNLVEQTEARPYEKYLVSQRNELIQATFTMNIPNIYEMKLLLFSIAHLQPSMKTFKGAEFVFTYEQLEKIFNCSRRTFGRKLPEICAQMGSRSISVNEIVEEDELEGSFAVFPVVKMAVTVPKKKQLKIIFNELAAPYLLNMTRNFTSYALENILALERISSILLYQRFAAILMGNSKQQLEMTHKEIVEALGLKQKNFSAGLLNQRVLTFAIQEINEATNLEVSYTLRRKSKSVKEDTFCFEILKVGKMPKSLMITNAPQALVQQEITPIQTVHKEALESDETRRICQMICLIVLARTGQTLELDQSYQIWERTNKEEPLLVAILETLSLSHRKPAEHIARVMKAQKHETLLPLSKSLVMLTEEATTELQQMQFISYYIEKELECAITEADTHRVYNNIEKEIIVLVHICNQRVRNIKNPLSFVRKTMLKIRKDLEAIRSDVTIQAQLREALNDYADSVTRKQPSQVLETSEIAIGPEETEMEATMNNSKQSDTPVVIEAEYRDGTEESHARMMQVQEGIEIVFKHTKKYLNESEIEELLGLIDHDLPRFEMIVETKTKLAKNKIVNPYRYFATILQDNSAFSQTSKQLKQPNKTNSSNKRKQPQQTETLFNQQPQNETDMTTEKKATPSPESALIRAQLMQARWREEKKQ